jgi:hypothetical protein
MGTSLRILSRRLMAFRYACADATITSQSAALPNAMRDVCVSCRRTVTSPNASMPAVTLDTVYSSSLISSAPGVWVRIALNAASTGPVPVQAMVTSEPSLLSKIVAVAVGICWSPHSTWMRTILKRSCETIWISSFTIDSKSALEMSFFLSASSLKRMKALFSSSSDTAYPSSVKRVRKACLPECLPRTILFSARP